MKNLKPESFMATLTFALALALSLANGSPGLAADPFVPADATPMMSIPTHSGKAPMHGVKLHACNAYLGLDEHGSEAVSALERLVAETPRDWRSVSILAWVYATYSPHNSDPDLQKRALDYALRSREINPDDAVTYVLLAAAQLANGLFNDAEQTAWRGLGLSTSDHVSVCLLSLAQAGRLIKVLRK